MKSFGKLGIHELKTAKSRWKNKVENPLFEFIK
jgi:hypothetical protein